jgi:TRAP transporter TAXI family solute receptor
MTRIARTTLIFSALAAAAFIAMPAAAEKIVTIGTAGVTGVYYPAGGAICRLVNRNRKETGIRCEVESTGGSISNLEGVHKGDLEMGVVQSDLLYQAYNGKDIFADVGADKVLRVLLRLHSEPFTVLARKEAGIKTFDDLKGKKLYLGAPGSGPRATMEELMRRKGWNSKSFTSIDDLKASDQGQALCSGKIDAMIYAGGHPNGAIQQVTSMCATKLVDVSGPAIDQLIDEHPFYSHAVIPGGMYPGNPRDVHTFGVEAVLIASKDLDDSVAYEVVKAVFDNLDNFKTLHPVFSTLNAKHMVPSGEIAPIHPGALKYYQEKGWVD